jgi:hypothetical protein
LAGKLGICFVSVRPSSKNGLPGSVWSGYRRAVRDSAVPYLGNGEWLEDHRIDYILATGATMGCDS